MIIELISNGMALFSCQITNPWILHLRDFICPSAENSTEFGRSRVVGGWKWAEEGEGNYWILHFCILV